MKRCFFDILVGGIPKGRIAFELDDEKYPKTVENFYHLCIGDKMNAKGNVLHFKGSRFHNIRNDSRVLIGGDFEFGNGTGGASIYGRTFPQEEHNSEFDHPGSLAMISIGEGHFVHSSLFFINAAADPHAFPTQNAFGHVIAGMDLVEELTHLGDVNGHPMQEVIIGDCNAMP